MLTVTRRVAPALLSVLVLAAACADPAAQPPETGTVELAGSPPPTVDEVGAPAPPDAERQPRGMFLSHRRVDSVGQLVALAMVLSPGDGEVVYGIDAALERWDGNGWALHAPVGTALTRWGRDGRAYVGVDPRTVAYESIDLSAAPGQAGPLEWVTLPALEPGWYRFARADASAPFEAVDASAPVGPDLAAESVTAAILDVEPAIVPTAGVVRLVPVEGPRLAEEDVVLEEWDGADWTEAVRTRPDVSPEPTVVNALEAALPLPDLRPGAYRLTATDEGGGRRVGHLFATGGVCGP